MRRSVSKVKKGARIMKLRLLQVREAMGDTVKSAEKVAELMGEEAKADRECFWVLHLNTQLQLIDKELVAMGSLEAAIIHPREVFRKAIINSAHAIVTVHNHPSGGLIPSEEDKVIWRTLREAGELLQIKVLDNLIIVPGGGHYSEASDAALTVDIK